MPKPKVRHAGLGAQPSSPRGKNQGHLRHVFSHTDPPLPQLESCLQELGPIQALVGPNASGKTTFLDAIGLLSDLVKQRGDVRDAVFSRSIRFDKLIWQGPGTSQSFQLAVEAPIPPQVRARMAEDKPSFKLGQTKAALANIPADEKSFPVSTWSRGLLESGVQNVVLNSHAIRQPSPPRQYALCRLA